MIKNFYTEEYFQKHTNHYFDRKLEKIPSFLWIKQELMATGKEKVLDVGCGTGYLLNYICKDQTGVGVDISTEAISLARKNFPRHTFVLGNLLSLPFKTGEFDKVICFNVLEHIEDQNKALKEINRVLKKDGILIAGTIISNSFSWKLFKLFLGGDKTHVKEFKEKEFINFISRYFKVIKTTRSTCVARFPLLINKLLNSFLKGDILVKAIK